MSTFKNRESGESPRLRAALEKLDGLVDWERRNRVPDHGPRMRQSTQPARDLFDRLGSPDAGMRCILIAGTKGKGSVAALIAASLTGAGERVGLYASPHVVRIHERIRIDGVELDDETLAHALEVALEVRELAVRSGSAATESTWFDLLTAAALGAFRTAGCGWAVLECGLGGRLDSTNAVEPCLSVITNIGLEHTALLGSTRALIAREKAGILRSQRPVVSAVGARGDEAADVVSEVAEALGARLVSIAIDPDDSIDARNLRVATAVLLELRFPPPTAELQAATRLPGRMDITDWRGTRVVFDGAHVPGSLALVLRDLERAGGPWVPPLVLLGLGEDKDAAGMLKVLRGRVDRVLCTSVGDGPYARPEFLAALANDLGFDAEAIEDPWAALEMAQRQAGATGWILVTGSLHLVGRLRGQFLPPLRIL